MPARKLQKFVGIAPKISPELLPDQAAQNAVNCKLYSGDLIPYRSPSDIGSVARSGDIKTIYPLLDPADGTTKKWLSWTTDVDVAVASSTTDNEQRIYYTGDGVPKVTTYAKAVTGSGPYPVGFYELGLPLPTTVPTVTPTAISATSISDVSRNTENIATFTATSHGLRSGLFATVSGFAVVSGTYTTSTSADTITVTISNVEFEVGGEVFLNFTSGSATSGYFTIDAATSTTFTVTSPGIGSTSGNVNVDMKTLNVKAAEITVVDDDNFTAYSAGAEFAVTGGTFSTIFGSDIEVELSGTDLGRTYLYTWMTPWNEESIPSDPSVEDFIREGQEVVISGLPTAGPSGDNYIKGFRIYRTVTSTTGSSYILLRTVWFPISSTFASRTSNVVTITMGEYHNLLAGDKIKISGVAFGGTPDATYDVTDVEVTEVVDKYSFTYTAAGGDKVETATTAGTLYSDIAEYESGTSRYYEGSTFTDDYDVGGLAVELASLEADAPDDDMQGLKSAHNNMMVGFVGNELCISDPDKPWSWPIIHRKIMDNDIVAVEPIAGAILVLTTKHPYIVSGNTPANMDVARIDTIMPCVSKRGVVNVGYGVLFPSHGGLAVYSPSTGPDLATKLVHDWDTWEASISASSIIATFYDGKYFASHSSGSFVFERDDQIGGKLVTTPIRYYAAYYDHINSQFFYIADTAGNLSEWDASGQPFLSLEWKSKVFVTPEYMKVGAARVIADYGDISDENTALLAYNTNVPVFNAAIWALVAQTGTLNGPVDYTNPDTSTYTPVYGTLNEMTLNGDTLTQNLRSQIGVFALGFKVWANKELVHNVVVTDSEIFRLPAGYSSDTIEVSVTGAARVRAIHFGETPAGLRGV